MQTDTLGSQVSTYYVVPTSSIAGYNQRSHAFNSLPDTPKGIYNFCNRGAISHNEVLQLYKEIIDPTYEWTNFSVEEQNKILAAKRSNNELDATKLDAALAKLGCPVPEIHDAFKASFLRMKQGLVAKYGADYKAHLPKKLGVHK